MNYKKYVALRNVYFSFVPGGKQFFQDLSIDFKVGRINFICGKNGMGKSTLLKILSGNTKSHEVQGIFKINDEDYDLKRIDNTLPEVGIVSQNFNTMLVDSYSFHENLQFALLAHYPSLRNLPQALPLPAFVEKYGINFGMPINLLSGGQRQILSILMVLQRSPQVLLLDEPTAALDEENAIIVMDFLEDLCKQENITIIAIIHHLDLVKKYADSTYFELYQDHGVRSIRTIAM